MGELIAGVIGALSAGALAKANEVGGRVVLDAYESLKARIIQGLGKTGAVQSVEDEPESEAAQETLAQAMTKAKLASDPELTRHAETLREAIGEAGGSVKVGDITAKVNVLVERLVASGPIELGNLSSGRDATVRDIYAGVDALKKA